MAFPIRISYNTGIMSSPLEVQIDWIKRNIKAQVDAGIEGFTLMESGESKLLEFAKVVVKSVINKLTVGDALDYFYHLQDTGELRPGKDRIVCLNECLVQWIELELAKRYA
jgi:hypothetical protein